MSANCASCGQTNLADARFCSACGSALAALADVGVGIVGENLRPATWVVVDEVKSGNWGVGGQALTLDDVKALTAGNP